MTAEQMFYVARRLANQCFTRYWLNWTGENMGSGAKAVMALCCVEHDGRPASLYEGDLPKGWTKQTIDGRVYYTWPRLDDKGAPFIL